jgi:hypothetical protein
MRRYLLTVLALLASLALTAGTAQAVVVDMSAVGSGHTSVAFNNADRGGYYGVALVPSTRIAPNTADAVLASVGIPYVTSSGQCDDPALTPDLVLPDTGICYHGGPVMHRNETLALTWDPDRRYWSGTRSYVEQFLRNVADGSGALTSPLALTPQYSDTSGRAGNQSKYGGGCIDYGNPNHVSNQNTTCLFGNSVQTGPGDNYPANGCQPNGQSYIDSVGNGFVTNDVCLTDAQIRSEVKTIVSQMGITGHIQPGYHPMISVLLPSGVEACLDAAGKLCSANGTITPPAPTVQASASGGKLAAGVYQVEITYVLAGGETEPSVSVPVTTTSPTSSITISSPPLVTGALGWYAYISQPGETPFARQQATPTGIGSAFTLNAPPVTGAAPPVKPYFCSYHSQVTVGGTNFAYAVQPWTPMTQCDEPDSPAIPPHPLPAVLSTDVGIRLVSPLSQSMLPAIVDPSFNGWFAQDGSEINDNGGCVPLGDGLDTVTAGGASYLLQREWNNAGAMESDPFTYGGCAPDVTLSPSFVVPSPIDQGKVVVFDGSDTASTLIVPNGDYAWKFGDGTTATGPSVTHSFAKSGYYKVQLTVTDRGGNVRSLTQNVEVLGPDGQQPRRRHNQAEGPPAAHAPEPGRRAGQRDARPRHGQPGRQWLRHAVDLPQGRSPGSSGLRREAEQPGGDRPRDGVRHQGRLDQPARAGLEGHRQEAGSRRSAVAHAAHDPVRQERQPDDRQGRRALLRLRPPVTFSAHGAATDHRGRVPRSWTDLHPRGGAGWAEPGSRRAQP